MYHVRILNENRLIEATGGEKLLHLLRDALFLPDAPCGGQGTCGKCKVSVDGEKVLACCITVDRDMTVALLEDSASEILTDSFVEDENIDPVKSGYLLAIDIGTTTLAGCLLNGETGEELAAEGMLNPQTAYGADVISRIRYAQDDGDGLTAEVRAALNAMTDKLCVKAGISAAEIGTVSVVGNPAMQQLFLGISTKNLSEITFAPVLTKTEIADAAPYLSTCVNARMLIVPDISGYIGADTVGCVLATGMDRKDGNSLLVDIGTNGEMVLRSGERMAACSTAAGPALEGANIRFGMRAREGAIDHVRLENGSFRCSVIGGGEAEGICGSGLIDAVTAALDAGLINERGRILNEEHVLWLTDRVYLTQEDIRQVQMAKGAIAAGIELLASHLEIGLREIDRVLLAGAFGSYLDPASACRIGLLPSELAGKIKAVGNAALGGAKMLACNRKELERSQELTKRIEFVELANVPVFPRCFARNMRF